uniref:Required for Drug-induced Death 1 n=1 Tax=Mus spicilegus TaxID=10103 RepID=A0A8C6G4E0_MUSSI
MVAAAGFSGKPFTSAPVILDPTAWVCCDLWFPERTGPGRSAGAGAGRSVEQRLPHSLGPSPELGGIMTVGARLRSKAASSLVGRGPLGRSRRAGDEETDAIVEHLEGEDEDPASPDCEREEGGRRAGNPSARRVHLAALPERYDSLEEPAPGDKPKKRYRRKLKKYGKNFGKAISKGCRYIVIGLQGFAAAYSAPFGVATSVVSFVR